MCLFQMKESERNARKTQQKAQKLATKSPVCTFLFTATVFYTEYSELAE